MRRLSLLLVLLLPSLARAQAFRVGSGIQLVPRASEPSHNAANGTLWIDSGASNVLKYCNPASSCITLGSGGGGSTLAAAYAAGSSQTDSTIGYDSTRLGIRLRDNATPISGDLFAVQNSAGSTSFFKVSASAVTLGAGTVPSADNTINLGGSANRYNILYALEVGSGASSLTHTSGVANSGTNVAHIFNSSNTLSGTTRLASFRNNGSEKLAIEDDGALEAGANALAINGTGVTITGTSNSVVTAVSGNASLVADHGNGAKICYSGICVTATSTDITLGASGAVKPGSDSTPTLGTTSLRFKYGYIGSSGADVTCDANSRGAFRVFFAAGGSSDELRACMKAAADTYAFRTIYTAP